MRDDAGAVVADRRARVEREAALVQRADDGAVGGDPVGERTAGVRAGMVEREPARRRAEQRDPATGERDRGFSSAVAAYGSFLIPQALKEAIERTGGPEPAFVGFIAYYVVCIAVTAAAFLRPDARAQRIAVAAAEA